MRVLFAGTPAVALPSLSALLDSPHDVVAVLTRPDAGAGRGRRPRPSPVREAADRAGVPVLTPARLREPEVREQIEQLAPQACPVVAYGALVPPDLLRLPEHGWVNLHFSLLPAWRGAAPVQHALLHGDELTGATTFLLEEGLDTGPVLGTLTERVGPRDTAGELLDRLAEAGAELLVATLDALERGEATPVPQPAEGVSHAPRLEAADARVDWSRPAFAVDRLVRACTPAPGAWTLFRGQRLKLGPVHPVEGPDGRRPGSARPGELIVHGDGVDVGTGSGPVRLGEVQAHGKRWMPAADWARGVRPEAGEVLGG